MHSVVAASSDTIRIWGLDGQRDAAAEHECVADTAADVVDTIASVSWAAGGATFVAAGKGTALRQYGWTGEVLQDIKASRGVVRGSMAHVVAVRHYGEGSNALFVADNTARQVRRWDFVRREYTAVCQTHDSAISCMDVCPKKRLVATASAHGGEIALFNLLHNTRSDLRSATHKALTCVSIAPVHRSLVAIGSEDGLVQLFDAVRSGAAPQRTFSHVHSAPLRGIAFHPLSHSTIITSGLDRRIVITDTNAYPGGARAKGALEISAKVPLTCLSCSQDPCAIGVGTIDGDVLVYDSRMPATPLWHASVKPNHAVVSMDIVLRTAVTSVDDMSILAKDRSYMDLLSPTKPDAGPGASNPARPGHRWIGTLSFLTGDKPTGSLGQDADSPREQPRSPAATTHRPDTARRGHLGPVSPAHQPWPLRGVRPERGPAADAGDSMMEMFTPEKQPRPSAHTRGTGATVVERAYRGGGSPADAAPPRDIARTFVSRLLGQRGQESVKPAVLADSSRDTPAGEVSAPVAQATTPSALVAPQDTPPNARLANDAQPIERHSLRHAPAPAPVAAAVEAEVVRVPAVVEMASVPEAVKKAPAPVAVEKAQTAAATAPAATGLGALSSSVLQNAVSDALTPFCEQLRGEMRNLHLDMIRQGFVQQEQIKALRRGCDETQALRAEIEQLRQENAQLRRHMPFFHLPADDVGRDGMLRSLVTHEVKGSAAWKLGRLNHVALAVPDLEQARVFWRDVMCAEKVSESVAQPEHGVYTVFVELGNTKIELLHPYGAESPIAAFLERNKSGGIHHVCLEVVDIAVALDALKASGVRPLSSAPKVGAHGLPVVFLHPKDCGGVLVEIEEKRRP